MTVPPAKSTVLVTKNRLHDLKFQHQTRQTKACHDLNQPTRNTDVDSPEHLRRYVLPVRPEILRTVNAVSPSQTCQILGNRYLDTGLRVAAAVPASTCVNSTMRALLWPVFLPFCQGRLGMLLFTTRASYRPPPGAFWYSTQRSRYLSLPCAGCLLCFTLTR